MIGTDSNKRVQGENKINEEFQTLTFDPKIMPCNCQTPCRCDLCEFKIQIIESNRSNVDMKKHENNEITICLEEAEEIEDFLHLLGETGIPNEPKEIINTEKSVERDEDTDRIKNSIQEFNEDSAEMEAFLHLLGETGMQQEEYENTKEEDVEKKPETNPEPKPLFIGTCHCTGKCRKTCPGFNDKKDKEDKKPPSKKSETDVTESNDCGCHPCVCPKDILINPSIMIDECFCIDPCKCEFCPGPNKPHIEEFTNDNIRKNTNKSSELSENHAEPESDGRINAESNDKCNDESSECDCSDPCLCENCFNKSKTAESNEKCSDESSECDCSDPCLCENCSNNSNTIQEDIETSLHDADVECSCGDICNCEDCPMPKFVEEKSNAVVQKILSCNCEAPCTCDDCSNTEKSSVESKNYICNCKKCSCVKCPGLDSNAKLELEKRKPIDSSKNENQICDCTGPCLPECIRNKMKKPKSDEEICDCTEPCLPECIRKKKDEKLVPKKITEKICDCTEPCLTICSGKKLVSSNNIFDLIKPTSPCNCIECKCLVCDKFKINTENATVQQPIIFDKIKPNVPCNCLKPCQCRSCTGLQNTDIIPVKVPTDIDFCNCVELEQIEVSKNKADASKLKKKTSCHCTDLCKVGCPGYNKNKITQSKCQCLEPCPSGCPGKETLDEKSLMGRAYKGSCTNNSVKNTEPAIKETNCKCETCKCASCSFLKIEIEKMNTIKTTSSGCSCAPVCACEDCYFINKKTQNDPKLSSEKESICKCSIQEELCTCSATNKTQISQIAKQDDFVTNEKKCNCLPFCQCEECPILNQGLDKGKCGCKKPCPCDNCLGLQSRNKVLDPDLNRDCCCSIPCNCEKCPVINFKNIMDIFTSVSTTCVCKSSCTCFYCGGRPKSDDHTEVEETSCPCDTKCNCIGCKKRVL